MKIFVRFVLLFVCLFYVASVSAQSPLRPLAPGVLKTIPPNVEYEDVFTRADATEVLAALPKPPEELADDILYDPEHWAKDVRFTRAVYCLEFSFKPLRIVPVDIPNKNGTMDKKLVWYMVYQVKNTGEALQSKGTGDVKYPLEGGGKKLDLRNENTSFKSEKVELPVNFVPQFVLSSERVVVKSTTAIDPETETLKTDIEEKKVAYVDRVIPLAIPVIMRREGFGDGEDNIPATTVNITKKELKPSDSAWGVAMWTDVDPKISKFSIFVSGLTNAYQWEDQKLGEEGSYKEGAPLGTGRRMKRRILQLNWQHLGDEFDISDKEIKFGWTGAVDYEWIYR
ncbi:MAG: hypothetical protein LBU65_01245 [Planctomycetaceae bacterium]|jgi:hypothetical protein|nr:hypothetical protein [Planctomycetaceae bacterium]